MTIRGRNVGQRLSTSSPPLPTERTPIQPSKPTFVKSSLPACPQPLPIFPVGKIASPSCPEAQCRWVSSSACFSLKMGSSLIAKAAGPHLGAFTLSVWFDPQDLHRSGPIHTELLPGGYTPPTACHHVCPAPEFLLLEPKSGSSVLREPGLSALQGWVSPPPCGGHLLHPLSPAPFPQPLTRQEQQHRQHLHSGPRVSSPPGLVSSPPAQDI